MSNKSSAYWEGIGTGRNEYREWLVVEKIRNKKSRFPDTRQEIKRIFDSNNK